MSDKKTILVIDDVEENVDIITQKLKAIGYNVISAYEGNTGLSLARQEKPDLVLCDIMLPGIDGWEILAAIRRDENIDKVPVILMTAYTTIQFRGERRRAIELGATDYLKKPFDLSEMVELVQRHIGK